MVVVYRCSKKYALTFFNYLLSDLYLSGVRTGTPFK
jgi:hypothetical protein